MYREVSVLGYYGFGVRMQILITFEMFERFSFGSLDVSYVFSITVNEKSKGLLFFLNYLRVTFC